MVLLVVTTSEGVFSATISVASGGASNSEEMLCRIPG